MNHRSLMICGAGILAALGICSSANALDWGTFGTWDSQSRRDAADAAMQAVVNRFNVYGDFDWGSDGFVDVYYNPSVPTAQASYYGSIEFGGTWPNQRVAQHELNHWLGSGTYGNWYNLFSGNAWTGPKVNALFAQFDGDGAVMLQSGYHFYPYGLNYDSEVINNSIYMRNVAIMYAMRQDMGNGNPDNPWSATSVTLTGSDPVGTSAFNWFGGGYSGSYPGWSDMYFAHAGAAYSTGNYLLRTPLDTYNPGGATPSFTFAGDSLTINNTNGAGGGLLLKGVGTTSVLTIDNLILDGGYVRHASGSSDLCQLAGNITLAGNPTIDAAQGDIIIHSTVGGTGSLLVTGNHTVTLSGRGTYGGSTTISAGTLRLALATPVASYTFDNIRGSTVLNGGTGGAAMDGTLAGGATIVAGGQSGNAVSLAGGASVDINSPIVDLGNTSRWTVSAWVNTTTPGASVLTKSDGTGWVSGNTVFYLGDGVGAGSGGIPSSVRNSGGFFQASASATPVSDGAWHLVTYVNDNGSYAIYTDGVAQPLSGRHHSFTNADVGSAVRLGVSTDTVPSDGTVDFNGLLDNVQFFSQALSADQVAALYSGQCPGPLPPTTAVSIASGATLDVDGLTQQVGSLAGPTGASVTLGAGHLIVDQAIDTQFSGVVSGTGGSWTKSGPGALTLSGANEYTGSTIVSGGTLVIDGTTGFGQTSVASGATLGGGGLVRGSLVASPAASLLVGEAGDAILGQTLTVGGDLSLEAGATLEIDLAQTAYDTVDVAGAAVLDGVLAVTLQAGFTPDLNDAFTVLSAASVANNLTLGGPDGSLFSLAASTPTELILTAASGLEGDYNNNGVVDAADYTVWRDALAAGTISLLNDPTPATVGESDYTCWKNNFGATLASGSGSGSSLANVPEPATFVLLLGASAVLAGRRRTRARSSKTV